MSGKSYTMKEMKAIVEYLTERKAYGEIKGRKMWVDFEKSKFTDRTWQSLKETFLKRILPDIHNPYYQLSLVQITSFRQGYDVEARLNSKLEVRTVSEGSSTDAAHPENTEQPSTSNNKDGEKKSGEEKINSKTVSHHRASAETIILDPCYETAEDIQKDLESPRQSTEVKERDEKSPPKTLRDFITYSEPLTPMLQEVIDDFATDEECNPSDDEPQMEIAEDVENDKDPKKSHNQTDVDTVEISSGTDDVSNSNTEMEKECDNRKEEKINENGKPSQDIDISADNPQTTSVQDIIPLDDSENVIENSKSNNVDVNNDNKDFNEIPPLQNKSDNISKIDTENDPQEINSTNVEKVTFSQDTPMENFSNTTTDTLIPNNQEELSSKSEPTVKDTKKETPSKDGTKNLARKRANSQEVTGSQKKKRSLTLNTKTKSVSDTDASDKRGNKLKIKTKIDNVKETNSEISDKGNKSEDIKKQNIVDLEEVPEEVTKDNVEEVTNEKTNNEDKDDNPAVDEIKKGDETLVENPCLKSVSLYDEQFTTMKYSESSDDVVKKTRRQKKTSIQESRQDLSGNEIVILKSNSEEEVRQSAKKKSTATRNVRSDRDQALSNVFGFCSGAVTSSRKRRVSYQNRPRRQSHNKASSGSSDWTSESEVEFVSPPRGRKNRHARKYLKPKHARILSLEEEGGLFVMYGKKIYPVVKDGKIMKNVSYAPDRDSEDEEESFWKLKYIEEKKRTAQLTKLLHQSSKDDQHSIEGSAPIDQSSSSKKRKMNEITNDTEVQEKNTVQDVASKDTVEHPKNIPHEVKTLKIKITKQNEEVQLEGHWSQIHPVLNQVVQIFHKETEPKPQTTPSTSVEQRKTSSSGMSTPVIAVVDQEAHEKVDKIETEIFKEIEALDKGDVASTPQPTPQKEPEVAKRRGRSRKSVPLSESVPEVPEKKPRKMEPEKLPIQETVEKVAPAETENGISPATRKTRTPKKVLRENTERNEGNVRNTRGNQTKKLSSAEQIDNEANARYKLPSPPSEKKITRRSGANKSMKEQKTNKRYMEKRITIFSPPDNISINSVESSQGYQDSDVSPTLSLRKKKKCTATYHARGKFKNRLNARRKTFWEFDMSDQSSNSCPELSHNSRSKSSSTMYRSESYQLLMQKNRNYFNNLERIDEVNLNDQNEELVSRNRAINFNTSNLYNDKPSEVGEAIDVENSSNVSLPPSPVLSIVEHISISNNELKSIHDNIVNKENAHHLNEAVVNSDFKITDVDVTMPLMQQDCSIQSNIENVPEQPYDVNELPTVMTESFINKICTVNIQDNPTLSDTINQKLRNLLLESAKKIATKTNVTESTSNDRMEINGAQTWRDNEAKPKKRCSTPLKRRNTRKRSKQPEVEPFVEEEHVELYSQAGRRSCPPLIQIPNNVLNIVECENVPANTKNTKKGRKKKENIIKVKILRPRMKSCTKESNIGNISQRGESLHGDSGINDTLSSVLLQGIDESIDLIHNHSETCLQANDCGGDSVEFIENGTKSVISLDTNSDQSIEMEKDCKINDDFEQNNQTEIFNINHSEAALRNAMEIHLTNNMEDNEGTTYHTPLNSVYSASSIMTEDLSDPEQEVNDSTRPSKWYFLSEDETNTNFAFPTVNNNVSYGADLNKIFPITCAIPDLSNITEMSNDKALSARASRNDASSQSIIDNNS